MYGLAWNKYYFTNNGSILYAFIAVGMAARILISYVYSRKFARSAFEKNKTSTYCVQRNGKLMEIKESEIVVGDLVRLGFKEEVPASGLMVSGNSIFVKEGYEKNGEERIQNKMTLEACLKKMETMSSLDLKIGFEQQTLPSPVVLRGSELVQGSTYWLMMLSVTEEEMLRGRGFQK